jgi:hypothetical protein
MTYREDDVSQNTSILMEIAGNIGETRSDISNLKDNVSGLTGDFKDVKEQLSKAVMDDECTMRHVAVAKSLEAMKKDIVAEIKKVPTGQDHKIITPAMIREYQAALQRGDSEGPYLPSAQMKDNKITVADVEAAFEEKQEAKAEKKRRLFSFWLAAISTAVTLIGGCAVGFYKIAIYINRLESAISSNTQEVRSEIQKSQPKVVYIKTPTVVYPDSGVPEPRRAVAANHGEGRTKRIAAKKAVKKHDE